MKKKLIYIGLALLVISFVLLISAGSLITSTASSLLAEKNVTAGASSFTYVQAALNNQTAVFGMVTATPVNFYLFNSSGYLAWTSDVYSSNSPSGYKAALSLEGAGLLYGYSNTKSATVPYAAAIDNGTPFYQSNTLAGLVTGTYYLVVDNTNGSASAASAVKATIVYPSPTALQSSSSATASTIEIIASGAGFFILLIAGIVLVVYGFIKKNPMLPGVQPIQPKQKGDMTDEQIDQLYKNIKKKSQRKGRKNTQTKAE